MDDIVRRPLLEVAGLCYGVGGRPILRDLGLGLAAGESIAVTGPSGCGKTTLLMALLGLVTPDSGTVTIAGTDITRLSARDLAAHRRAHLGVVFQFGELLPELSPVENVALPALLGGTRAGRAYREAARLLADLGVPAAETPTGALSGGERQRTAVARALITRPGLLLADEPTGALDGDARDVVADLLFALPERHGCALLVVTHDEAVAARADRRLRLDQGRLAGAAA
ncbi:ABC transporter ATP-binding protein [Actinomadura rayongensis]|uniref:ATP-binding cassette domain-containing protein n=1 Tax=Actinomadura rayongensis TaxID=1429076 RepID=A0A6I4W7U3_9ACTN|nr:ABC transporter ATP-binding protein [Actinomadura rayongensis]MXQ62782.1 ATP-binding cassette domain-containing protein [Actinomadura rayongensis]